MSNSLLNTELLCSVSSNGDCAALCTPDGVIKFYDTLTSNLKLEYSSSTHLQANCTCLSWSKYKKNLNAETPNSKQKKLKSNTNIESELNSLDLIAIGTSQGAILLFSLAKGALHSQLVEGGHADKVNDICWCPQFSDSLYSCSDDGYIIEWSLIESKVKAKWKASKTAITSLAVDPTSNFLICSSKTVIVWDLKSKTKVKTLTGHSNDIFRLTFLNDLASKNQQNKNDKSNNSHYFISAAANDRIINAWTLDSSNTSSAALASFTANDSPIFLDVVNVSNSKDANTSPFALVCAVTGKGHLYIYNHQLTSTTAANKNENKLKKPIKAINQIQIETNEGTPLKIYGAFVTNSQNERLDKIDISSASISLTSSSNSSAVSIPASSLSQQYLYIVYGSHLNPKIEKLKFTDFNEAKITLKREDPFKTNVLLQTESTKIETPAISKDLKVLVPGYITPQVNNHLTINNNKRKSVEPSQMTLEERLNVMGINANENANGEVYLKNGQVPKTDNLLVLLVQGLQSNDAKMLNHVLQHKNEKVVAKTIRLLPTNYVVTLVKELNKRLQGHAQSGIGIIKWLKCVLMIHTSFLMSYPDLIESLGTVYEMMNARTKLFPQLSKLQGKLQLVMSQVSSQAEALQTANEKDIQPLLYYQDSTSEDEQIEDELIPSHSEFDEYIFSEEEEDEESNQENEDLEEEDETINEKPIKKEVVSFKKKKDSLKNKLVNKKKKSDDDDDDDDDDDESDEDDDEEEMKLQDEDDEDDEDEDDEEDDEDD